MSSKQQADALRRLADAIEQSQAELTSVTSIKGAYVSLRVNTQAAAEAIAGRLGIDPKSFTLDDHGDMKTSIRTEYLWGCLSYPAITIPRACEYCYQEHDCAHIDGEVQA